MGNDIFTVATKYTVDGFDNANNTLVRYNKAVDDTAKSQDRASKASDNATKATQRKTRAVRDANSAQARARQSFLATANSIAVLDGPLGGVASRFSAFGVLIGRIGIPLAAAGIAFSTFTFTAQRAVREFAEFEVQLATIENRLNSVGNQFNLTTQEIVRMSEQLALSTLADERQVLAAANSLLTFRNISTNLFEDILKSAQDLAASGFGTLESETLRLAKALEDPRQSLTSLSRAGIVFTRQQREMIISLIDTGREAEAMGLILQNVERQVGGAGLAQANNTLAGSLDTLGQAFRFATREFGEFVANELGVAKVIELLADAAARYIENSQVSTLNRDLEGLTQRYKELTSQLEVAADRSEGLFRLGSAALRGGQRFADDVQADIDLTLELIEAKKEEIRLEQALRDVRESELQLSRREEALDNLEMQIQLQETLVGLTQEQERVQRALAAEGFGGNVWANINDELDRYATNLAAAGVSQSEINRKVADMRIELEGARDIAERYAEVFERQSIAREINRIEEASANTNAILTRQVEILEDARAAGNDALTVTEARRQAELEAEIQTIKTQQAIVAAAGATALLAMNFAEAAKAAAEVARLALIIKNLEDNADLTLRLGDLGRTGRGGGGGGSGVDPNAEYQKELDALVNYLDRRREEMMIARGFERELIIEQYEERFQILQNALDRRLITLEQYKEKEIALTESREDAIRQIEEASARSRLSFVAGIFGDMASAAQAGGDRMIKVASALAFTQGMINAHLAYTQALADPTIPSTLAKIGFAAKVFGLAANAARAARGGGSGGRAAASATAAAPREVREAAPQRVLITGLDPRALYSGEQLEQLFESFMEENRNRGMIFTVNR